MGFVTIWILNLNCDNCIQFSCENENTIKISFISFTFHSFLKYFTYYSTKNGQFNFQSRIFQLNSKCLSRQTFTKLTLFDLLSFYFHFIWNKIIKLQCSECFWCHIISASDSADDLSVKCLAMCSVFTLQYYTNIQSLLLYVALLGKISPSQSFNHLWLWIDRPLILKFVSNCAHKLLQAFTFSDSYPKAVNFMRYLNKLQKKLSFVS